MSEILLGWRPWSLFGGSGGPIHKTNQAHGGGGGHTHWTHSGYLKEVTCADPTLAIYLGDSGGYIINPHWLLEGGDLYRPISQMSWMEQRPYPPTYAGSSKEETSTDPSLKCLGWSRGQTHQPTLAPLRRRPILIPRKRLTASGIGLHQPLHLLPRWKWMNILKRYWRRLLPSPIRTMNSLSNNPLGHCMLPVPVADGWSVGTSTQWWLQGFFGRCASYDPPKTGGNGHRSQVPACNENTRLVGQPGW